VSQCHALSRLSLQTLIGLERVGFEVKARALPGVVDARESLGDVDLVGDFDEDDCIEVRAMMRLKPQHEERMIVTARYIVAGGLAHDDDCQNPLDDEGNGKLVHRGRRGNAREEHEFNDALGLDQYGDRDLCADAVCVELYRLVWERVRADKAQCAKLVRLLKKHDRTCTVKEAIAQAMAYGGTSEAVVESFTSETRMGNLELQDAIRLLPLTTLADELQMDAWRAAMRKGTLGVPHAQLVDIYEHGLSSYTLAGSGMQDRWDTTSAGALWVPCEDALYNIRHHAMRALGLTHVDFKVNGTADVAYSLDNGATWVAGYATWHDALVAMLAAAGAGITLEAVEEALATAARAYAKPLLEEYTSWGNGDCYGVVVYVIDRTTGRRVRDHDDECWGYLGSSYAAEELEARMLSLAATLTATRN
jgi:hypothetical protein